MFSNTVMWRKGAWCWKRRNRPALGTFGDVFAVEEILPGSEAMRRGPTRLLGSDDYY
jgi:hypothetical protein